MITLDVQEAPHGWYSIIQTNTTKLTILRPTRQAAWDIAAAWTRKHQDSP